jgi:hypothetical protein
LFFTDKITDGLKSRRCYLAVFWKKSINLKFSFKYYRQNHRRIEKSSVIVGDSWKLLRNWKFKLNITDGITDGIIKKILIFNYPSVNLSLTRPNKKPKSSYFTRDKLISYYSFSTTSSSSSSSLYVKNINIYLFLFFSLLISFSFPPCSGMSSSSFFFYPLSFF